MVNFLKALGKGTIPSRASSCWLHSQKAASNRAMKSQGAGNRSRNQSRQFLENISPIHSSDQNRQQNPLGIIRKDIRNKIENTAYPKAWSHDWT